MVEESMFPAAARDDAKQALKQVTFPVLDKGFVRLIDFMGSDAAIVQAARVSYGSGTKSVSDDETLIRYLMRNYHCYDDQTEVLTTEGFKRWNDVTEDDLLGCWDEEVGSLVYEKSEYLTKDQYSGKMYQVVLAF